MVPIIVPGRILIVGTDSNHGNHHVIIINKKFINKMEFLHGFTCKTMSKVGFYIILLCICGILLMKYSMIDKTGFIMLKQPQISDKLIRSNGTKKVNIDYLGMVYFQIR